jgi:hypothetical protein
MIKKLRGYSQRSSKLKCEDTKGSELVELTEPAELASKTETKRFLD